MNRILEKLKSIDVDKRIGELRSQISSLSDPRKRDKAISELKILLNLKDKGMSPYEAFVKKTVPVIPAQYRSPIELPTGTISLPDVNVLMRNIGIAKDSYINMAQHVDEKDLSGVKATLYKHVEKLMGMDTAEDGLKNYWDLVNPADKPPKEGFFQKNVIRKRVNLSGRSVISPNPDLDIDKIEIPFRMGMDIYKPFIVKEMKDRGYTVAEIDKMIDNEDDKIKECLQRVGDERPVLMNRAPSIANGSITAHWPIFVNKKNINIPNMAAVAMRGDFDGDTVVGTCRISTTYGIFRFWILVKFFLTELRRHVIISS